jgi:hypothetical protein
MSSAPGRSYRDRAKALAWALVGAFVVSPFVLAIQNRIVPKADTLLGKVYSSSHRFLTAPAPVWSLAPCLLASAAAGAWAARALGPRPPAVSTAQSPAPAPRRPPVRTEVERELIEGLKWVQTFVDGTPFGPPVPRCQRCDMEIKVGTAGKPPTFVSLFPCDNPECGHVVTIEGDPRTVLDRIQREIQRRRRARRAAG